ncbi:MAG: nickel-responsive transcriptional regulator NikR [Calditrichae bacterium]|nr:nickel-responsive transcriptional regulator NikR [Calditrichota bacterium]MCB9057573.1 nickel-responsive transcriptional regulator NikR [Calditrichia bacterium]
MMKTIRFGVSLPQDLIESFDEHIRNKNYPNRSEAIRDLIRKDLISEEIIKGEDILGVLHILYDHHKRELSDKLTAVQHDHHDLIISSTHVHLDHDNCLEVILLKGNAAKITALSNQIIATKGVNDGKLYLTSKG